MTAKFREKYGPWAIITGASSGLGSEFAKQLASRGLNLLLVARREERLTRLASELNAHYDIEARAVVSDLSKPNFMKAIRSATRGIEIGMLINNAGFGIAGDFLNNDPAAELDMIQLNCIAPYLLAREFGAKMAERRRGGIIFVSSLLGHIPAPYMANYSATKAYNLFLGESLWYELRHFGTDVLVLSPGPIETEFASVAGMKMRNMMSPEQVASIALAKIGKRPSVTAGTANRVMVFLGRLVSRQILIRGSAIGMRMLGRGGA